MTADGSSRRRVRPSFRRAAMLAVVLLLPFAGHALWDYVEARRLSNVVEDIRRRGEPVHFGKLGEGRPATPEQTRAARYYGAAAVLAADAYGARFAKAAELIDAMSLQNAPIPAGDPRLVQLQSMADSYSPTLDLLDRAAALDAKGLDYASEPRYGFIERNLANVNALRVIPLALLGDGDAAATALLATLRARRVVNNRFALNFPVVTLNTLRVIATFSSPSEPTFRALQQAYEERDDENDVTTNLLIGRGMIIEAVWPGAQGKLASLPRVRNSRPRPYLLDGLLETTLRPWHTNRFRRMLSIYAEAIDASKQPWPAKLDAAKAFEERFPLRRQPFGTRPTLGLAPGFFEHGPAADFGRITRQTASILAHNRVCMTVLAIERHRRLRGDVPGELEALVPALLPAVPKDPYTGGPLRYDFSRAEYKVYSVGVNRRDDGGDLGPARSDLAGGPREPAKDIGIAVPRSRRKSTP